MILEDLALDADGFAAATGWRIESRGACRGAVCVPLPDTAGRPDLDVTTVARTLGMPIVHDEARRLWALGPASVGGRALATAEAPDIELPLAQSDGVWRLAEQRGRRTVIVAWAPW